MERNDFLQKYGPHIHGLVNNPAQIQAVIFVAEYEISKLRDEVQQLTILDQRHAAVICAGKAEGIKDFLAILNGVARDYGEAKTSLGQ